MAQRRLEKINELLRQTIAGLLLSKSKDPRLKMVNITGVKVTADLKKAVVHYSSLAQEEERAAIHKALTKAGGFIRSAVGENLQLKYAPEIKFEFDRNLEYAQHMSKILNRISTERQAESSEGEPEENV